MVSINFIQQTIIDINQYNSSSKGITRLAYSKEALQAMKHLISLCKDENLDVYIDQSGNLIARREGLVPDLPAVACGSHIDTVIEGGEYDGLLGVVSGLEVIRRLNKKGIKTKHPIELIAFASEESSRFNIGKIGSKAMAGIIKDDIHILDRFNDRNGISIHEAFETYNLDFNEIEKSERCQDELKVFFELHIEQGPVLEDKGLKVGIVKEIAAPTRFSLTIKGKAAHTGTTPMNNRRDALLGASEISIALEELAKEEISLGTVATVSDMKVYPGAMNVIPSLVEMRVDIRGISRKDKNLLVKNFFEKIAQISFKRGLEVEHKLIVDEEPVVLDDLVIKNLKLCADRMKIPNIIMPSGAGHDAMIMNNLCPAGIIFVPSKDGLSHHPNEFTSIEDIEPAVNLLEEQIILWANGEENNQKILN